MKRTALLVLACVAALGCDLAQRPKPAPILTVTPEAVTLIQETQEICVKVAKKGIERMRSAEEEQRRAHDEALEAAANSGDPLAARKIPPVTVSPDTLEKYLSDEAAPELAAVDRAGQLIRDLLPKVRDEAPREIAQAVQALSAGEEQVCSRARNPRPTRLNYQESLDYAVHDYNNAEAKLQALYTVSATDAQFASNKYNPLLDEARAGADPHAGSARSLSPEELRRQRKEWEATQQYQQEQQAQHDAAVVRWRQREEKKEPLLDRVGVAPDMAAQQSMPLEKRTQTIRSWYTGYSAKIGPVRTALASYMSLRRGSPPEKLDPVCRDLMTATTALVSDPGMFDLPDATAAKVLRKAFSDLQACAQACVAGQDAEAAFRLSAYEGEISQATTVLQKYGITP